MESLGVENADQLMDEVYGYSGKGDQAGFNGDLTSINELFNVFGLDDSKAAEASEEYEALIIRFEEALEGGNKAEQQQVA